MFLIIGLLGALAPVLAAGIGGIFGAKGQHDANKTNIDLAREQMAFQERMAHSAESFSERMSSTAIQRQVADFRAAGLNPALAYGAGGANAPTGVTAGGSQARVESTMRDMPQVASTALQLRSMAQEIRQSKERRDDEHDLMDANTKASLMQASKASAEIKNLGQTWKFNEDNQPFTNRTLAAEALLREAAGPRAVNEAEFERLINQKLKGGGTTARTILQLMQALRGAMK